MKNKCCENCTCQTVNPCHTCCHLKNLCPNCFRRLLEIQELPRAESLQKAKEMYGENWNVTDALVGKMNEIIRSVNGINRRLDMETLLTHK